MLKKEISIQICKLGIAINANEVCPWMLMRKCLLAMLIRMLVILILILMLLNFNTGNADSDADLCNRILSLCCINLFNVHYTLYFNPFTLKVCVPLINPCGIWFWHCKLQLPELHILPPPLCYADTDENLLYEE